LDSEDEDSEDEADSDLAGNVGDVSPRHVFCRDMSPKNPVSLGLWRHLGAQDCQSRVWPCRVTSHSHLYDFTR
jgi:hypothetical protein